MTGQRTFQFSRSLVALSCLIGACSTSSPGNGGASNFVTCSSDHDCPSGRCSARNQCVDPSEMGGELPDAGPQPTDEPTQPSVAPNPPSDAATPFVTGPAQSDAAPAVQPTNLPQGEPGPAPLRPVCEGHFDPVDQSELDELRGCQHLEGNLFLEPPEGVTMDLQALGALESVSGILSVGLNQWTAFDSIDGLRSLRSTGTLRITNTTIDSLAPLSNLESIGNGTDEEGFGILELYGNPNLEDLSGLEQLREFKTLELNSNEGLKSLAGLTPPEQLDYVSLVYLPALTSLEALSTLRAVGSMGLRRLDALETLTGLEGLQSIESLGLYENGNLAAVLPAQAVTQAGTIAIEGNPKLESFDFLPQLASVGELRLLNNELLATLDLEQLTEATSLTVVKNPQLDSGLLSPLVENMDMPGAAKIAGNRDETELLSPCPWANDGTCDEPNGLDICAVGTDPECVCTFECGQ